MIPEHSHMISFTIANRFFCNIGPHWPMLMCTWLLVGGPYVAAFLFLLPHRPLLDWAAAAVMLGLVSWSLCNTAFGDPGIVRIPRVKDRQAAEQVLHSAGGSVPRDEEEGESLVAKMEDNYHYCDMCEVFCPPDTEHCYFCGVCIEGYDHHCPWMGKCIGKKNLCSFYTFLITLFLSIPFLALEMALSLGGAKRMGHH